MSFMRGRRRGRLRAGKKVGRVEIEVVDSSSMGYLVSGRMVREWIAHSGIKTNGTAVDAVELAAIEALIAKNGFVERVDAYVTYGGVLHIDISQRRPLLRLLTDGVDSYVTPEGYVFAAPRASSLYVPVVTGGLPSAVSRVVRRLRARAYRPRTGEDRQADRGAGA